MGGTLEIADALSHFGELLRFAATAIEQPHLVFAGIARRRECEILAVGAPAGMRGRDSFSGKGNSIATASGDHPEALLVLFLLEHSLSNGIIRPLTAVPQLGLRA